MNKNSKSLNNLENLMLAQNFSEEENRNAVPIETENDNIYVEQVIDVQNIIMHYFDQALANLKEKCPELQNKNIYIQDIAGALIHFATHLVMDAFASNEELFNAILKDGETVAELLRDYLQKKQTNIDYQMPQDFDDRCLPLTLGLLLTLHSITVAEGVFIRQVQDITNP